MTDLVEKVTRAIVGGVVMDEQRDEVMQCARDVIAVVLKDMAKWTERTEEHPSDWLTISHYARENGIEL